MAITPELAALAVLGGLVVVLFVVLRTQSAALERLRLLTEQALAGTRGEAERTRAALEAIARDSTDRIASLRAAQETGIEQVRAVLGREQGELRLAVAEAHRQTAEQTAQQFEALRNAMAAQLGEIRASVNEQLASAVEKQMTDSFARVIDQFAAVQKAMGDVQAVTAQIGDLRRLFSNVKARGGWGETQVRALLDDVLPPGAYLTNHRIRPGSDEAVEFAVLMPMKADPRPVLPIDAKFPVEDYERLLSAWERGDGEGERAAVRALERRVRDEARKIAAKYIHPPVTVEFAVLYLPTDSLYAEVARIPGLIDAIGREQRVLVMGPTLFPALLRTIHLGFVTLALEQKADEIRDLLGATRGEMQRMDEVLARLARQVGTLGNTIETARVRTRAVQRKLRSVESVPAEAAESLLELGRDGQDAWDEADSTQES